MEKWHLAVSNENGSEHYIIDENKNVEFLKALKGVFVPHVFVEKLTPEKEQHVRN